MLAACVADTERRPRNCRAGAVRGTQMLKRARSGNAQVNARMGGGPVYAMNNFVWGIDLVEEQFLASCGIPSRPYLSKVPRKCIAEFSVNAQKTGTIQNVDWVDVCPRLLCFLPAL
jgi:hypothetical protein